jgi:hypothetical protein
MAEFVVTRDDMMPTQYLSETGTWDIFTMAKKFFTAQEAQAAGVPAGTTGHSQHVVQLPRMTGR